MRRPRRSSSRRPGKNSVPTESRRRRRRARRRPLRHRTSAQRRRLPRLRRRVPTRRHRHPAAAPPPRPTPPPPPPAAAPPPRPTPPPPPPAAAPPPRPTPPPPPPAAAPPPRPTPPPPPAAAPPPRPTPPPPPRAAPLQRQPHRRLRQRHRLRARLRRLRRAPLRRLLPLRRPQRRRRQRPGSPLRRPRHPHFRRAHHLRCRLRRAAPATASADHGTGADNSRCQLRRLLRRRRQRHRPQRPQVPEALEHHRRVPARRERRLCVREHRSLPPPERRQLRRRQVCLRPPATAPPAPAAGAPTTPPAAGAPTTPPAAGGAQPHPRRVLESAAPRPAPCQADRIPRRRPTGAKRASDRRAGLPPRTASHHAAAGRTGAGPRRAEADRVGCCGPRSAPPRRLPRPAARSPGRRPHRHHRAGPGHHPRSRAGSHYVRHNELDRFRYGARDIQTQTVGGETRTVVIRPDGTQIITVVGRDGQLLRRIRRDERGREIIIIDNSYRDPRAVGGFYVDLPPPVIRIPYNRYIVDAEDAPPELIYDTMMAPPVERIDRRYSLDEIRYSPIGAPADAEHRRQHHQLRNRIVGNPARSGGEAAGDRRRAQPGDPAQSARGVPDRRPHRRGRQRRRQSVAVGSPRRIRGRPC